MLSKEEIINKHRASLLDFMRSNNLNPNLWGRKSGVPESTIRHYLNGRQQSITALNLELLARSVGATIDDLISQPTKSDL